MRCLHPGLLEVFPWFRTRLYMMGLIFLPWKYNWLPGICPLWVSQDCGTSVLVVLATTLKKTKQIFHFGSYFFSKITFFICNLKELPPIKRDSIEKLLLSVTCTNLLIKSTQVFCVFVNYEKMRHTIYHLLCLQIVSCVIYCSIAGIHEITRSQCCQESTTITTTTICTI